MKVLFSLDLQGWCQQLSKQTWSLQETNNCCRRACQTHYLLVFSTRKVLHLAPQKVIHQIMTAVSCTLCLCRCYELTQCSDLCLPGSDKYAKIELLQKIVIRFGIFLIQEGVVAETIQFRISYFFFCKTWCTTATCSQKVLAKNDTLNFSRSGNSKLDEVFIRSFGWCQGFSHINKATEV